MKIMTRNLNSSSAVLIPVYRRRPHPKLWAIYLVKRFALKRSTCTVLQVWKKDETMLLCKPFHPSQSIIVYLFLSISWSHTASNPIWISEKQNCPRELFKRILWIPFRRIKYISCHVWQGRGRCRHHYLSCWRECPTVSPQSTCMPPLLS